MDGFGIHAGFGYLVVAARPRSSSSSASSPGSGSGGSGGTGFSALLLILQVLLAWFGFEVPAIGFFHPVNALLIFIVLLWIVNDTWRGGRTPGTERRRRRRRRPDRRRPVVAKGRRPPSLPSRYSGWLCAVPPVSNGVVTPM